MATCFEFNSCHLNTSSYCTWMNLRQKQHSCQEMSPSGLERTDFLGTCFLRSRNPLSYEVKWWVKLLGMDEEYGLTDYGGTLEQESFSHNKSPPGQRISHFPASFWRSVANANKSATHLPWLNGRSWTEGLGHSHLCVYCSSFGWRLWRLHCQQVCNTKASFWFLLYAAKSQHEMEY